MIGARALAAIIFASIFAVTATAHNDAKWIDEGRYRNAANELCCGVQDCGRLVSGTIREADGGYRVDAVFRIEMMTASGPQEVFIDRHEFVPYAEATPSQDRNFWICVVGGARRCFFAPMGST